MDFPFRLNISTLAVLETCKFTPFLIARAPLFAGCREMDIIGVSSIPLLELLPPGVPFAELLEPPPTTALEELELLPPLTLELLALPLLLDTSNALELLGVGGGT